MKSEYVSMATTLVQTKFSRTETRQTSFLIEAILRGDNYERDGY